MDDNPVHKFMEDFRCRFGQVCVLLHSVKEAFHIHAFLFFLPKLILNDIRLGLQGTLFVLMSGDETMISPTGYLMIHNPMTLASGNKSDMEKAIALLDEIKEGIINAYVRKTGLSRNKISKLMDDETWLNAEKALQLGFVDGILFDEKEPQESDENIPDEDADKPQKNTASMQYSPIQTTASFMQKISALAPVKGVPIDQLEKRLELLKY